MSITALNQQTGEEVVDPQKLAATRCLYTLVFAHRAMTTLDACFQLGDRERGQRALQGFVDYLTAEQPRMKADIEALTKLLGVEIVVLDKAPSPERMDA